MWEAAPAACATVICIASFIGSANGLEFERHREVSPVSGEVMLSRQGNLYLWSFRKWADSITDTNAARLSLP